jgi:hypothetical protein
MGSALEAIAGGILSYLTVPVKGYAPPAHCDPSLLEGCLRPGDVLLVDGDSRIAGAVKYLTQSTWSHSALYVGPVPGASEPDGEPHVLVEADALLGVISIPLSKYSGAHTRICRPVGMDMDGRRRVAGRALARIGHAYDLKHVFDLMRYLVPIPIPSRFRRRMIAFGSGDPTRAICSTMIAEAFLAECYPILPASRTDAGGAHVVHLRESDPYVPRDFDISPYFEVVKPTISAGFDHRGVYLSDRRTRQCGPAPATDTQAVDGTGAQGAGAAG